MSDPKPSPDPGYFPQTQWTRIVRVIQQGRTDAAWRALSDFCEDYRPAIVNFFCRHGCDSEQAQELTQEFFLKRILRPWEDRAGFLQVVDRAKGRFRAFLAHVLWLFLTDHWRSRGRGLTDGKPRLISLEQLAPRDDAPDGAAFETFGRELDRPVAEQILQRAATRSKGSAQMVAHFRRQLTQAEAARQLGQSSAAFKVAYDRFKKRFAAEIAKQAAKLAGPDPDAIRAEIRYLMSLFEDQP